MATLAMAGLVGYLALLFLDWGILSAVWEADNRQECLAKIPKGACWAGVIAWYNRCLYGRYPDAEIWRIKLALVILLIWMAPLWLAGVRAKTRIAANVVFLYPFWAMTLFLSGERTLISQGIMVAAMGAFAVTVAHVGFCLTRGAGLWDSFTATMTCARMPGRAPAFLLAMLLMLLH